MSDDKTRITKTADAMHHVRQLLASGELSIEELMDLATEELDAIEAGVRFADAETWMTVVSFCERAMKDPADEGGDVVAKALAILDRAPDVEPDRGDEIVNNSSEKGNPR